MGYELTYSNKKIYIIGFYFGREGLFTQAMK